MLLQTVDVHTINSIIDNISISLNKSIHITNVFTWFHAMFIKYIIYEMKIYDDVLAEGLENHINLSIIVFFYMNI